VRTVRENHRISKLQCRFEQDEAEGEEPPRYTKQNAGLHGDAASHMRILTVPFLRKFIYYSKTKFCKQQLTQDAFEEISQFYVEVRQAAATGVVDPRFRCAALFSAFCVVKSGGLLASVGLADTARLQGSCCVCRCHLPSSLKASTGVWRAHGASLASKFCSFECRPIPVTARTLETVIRLATAHSKLRFSRKIEKDDVEVARSLMLRIIDQSRTVEGDVDELPDEGDNDAAMIEDQPAPSQARKPPGSRCGGLAAVADPVCVFTEIEMAGQTMTHGR
jgi:hypothetical protein